METHKSPNTYPHTFKILLHVHGVSQGFWKAFVLSIYLSLSAVWLLLGVDGLAEWGNFMIIITMLLFHFKIRTIRQLYPDGIQLNRYT